MLAEADHSRAPQAPCRRRQATTENPDFFPLLSRISSTRTTKYDPKARYDIGVRELELRRTPPRPPADGAPKGAGPFPVLLDLHGGAWNTRTGSPTSRWTARWRRAACWWRRSTSPEVPDPASVQDANYGKAHEMVKSFIGRYLG
jgi:acetyl esterase/lipase